MTLVIAPVTSHNNTLKGLTNYAIHLLNIGVKEYVINSSSSPPSSPPSKRLELIIQGDSSENSDRSVQRDK
eukprot:scaffold286_cov169-Amphora_coffeaeformis.AAC.14